MDYQVVWTEPASADLEAIIRYVAANNASAAQRVADEILNRVELLKTLPFMGAIYPSGSHGRNRKIVVGKYRIFYRVVPESKQVDALTVWHSSRREPDLPV